MRLTRGFSVFAAILAASTAIHATPIRINSSNEITIYFDLPITPTPPSDTLRVIFYDNQPQYSVDSNPPDTATLYNGLVPLGTSTVFNANFYPLNWKSPTSTFNLPVRSASDAFIDFTPISNRTIDGIIRYRPGSQTSFLLDPSVIGPNPTQPYQPLLYLAQSQPGGGGLQTGYPTVRRLLIDGVQVYPSSKGASSIAFLPGLAGSRLYRTEPSGSVKQLWLPTFNNTICQNRPNEDGTSTDGIYTKDILDKAAYRKDIYGTFTESLEQMRLAGDIAAWAALPYDWRLHSTDIVENGIRQQSAQGNIETVSLLTSVLKLAGNSFTNKVTIVAHSNGGLVVKDLLNQLASLGQTNLIDQVIIVGAPQLGTPKALSILLHGESLDMSPVVFDGPKLRETVETMMGAYNMVPSIQFFQKLPGEVIRFDVGGVQPLNDYRNYFGSSISNYSDTATSLGLQNFLLATSLPRSEPYVGACASSGDSSVQLPNVLRSSLLLKAKRLHDAQDQWAPPPGVMLTQVVGLGIPTVRRIRYFIDPECKCMSHKLDTTNYGDGTVVSGSAGALPSTAAVRTFYFDMGAFNAGPGDAKEHSTMLGAAPLQTFIRNLVLGKADPTQGVPFISLATPRLQAVVNRITLKSPAELHAYDLSGRHTGPIANDPNFNLPAKDQNIPNSVYSIIDSHAVINLTGSDPYRVSLVGNAYGTVSLEVETFDDEQPVAVNTFISIPFGPKTTASLTLQGSNLTQLALDSGGGQPPLYFAGGNVPKLGLSVSVLAAIVQSLRLKSDLQVDLLDKLNSAISSISENKFKTAGNQLSAFNAAVNAQAGKAISYEAAIGLTVITKKILSLLPA